MNENQTSDLKNVSQLLNYQHQYIITFFDSLALKSSYGERSNKYVLYVLYCTNVFILLAEPFFCFLNFGILEKDSA